MLLSPCQDFWFHIRNLYIQYICKTLPTWSNTKEAHCFLSLSLLISAPLLLLSGRAFQMREVLGIPRERLLRFPDQLTVASVWTVANNNCRFYFPTLKSPPLRFLPTRSLFVSRAAKQQDRLAGSSSATRSILMLPKRAAHTGFWVAPSGSGLGKIHFLHFHPPDYQPEQVEADLMNPNEEAWPLSAAAAHDPVSVLKCQPLIDFLEMQLWGG